MFAVVPRSSCPQGNETRSPEESGKSNLLCHLKFRVAESNDRANKKKHEKITAIQCMCSATTSAAGWDYLIILRLLVGRRCWLPACRALPVPPISRAADSRLKHSTRLRRYSHS